MGGAGPATPKINHAGRSERIERAAGIRHRNRKHGGEDDSGESDRHIAHNEFRENAVRVAIRDGQKSVLRVNVEHHSEYEEESKLDEDDYAAGEEGFLAVAFGARGKKALDHGLVRAVAGHGEECSTDNSCPEGIALRQAPGEIENREFAAGGCSGVRYGRPTAGNLVQEQEERSDGAGEI